MRRATKSIAQFKLREGMPIGAKVTLRGARMWEFLDRLISIALPRIRDFRGLNPESFDGRGNYSLGIREQIIFPEIDYDSVQTIRGPRRRHHDHGGERRGRPRAAARPRLPVRRRRQKGRTVDGQEVPRDQGRPAAEVQDARLHRCNRCGRPRAVYKKFGLCRICLRELAHQGVDPRHDEEQLVGETRC